MTLLRYASTERVALAWLSLLPGLSSGMVDTALPDLQVTDWSTTGFVVVTAAGGSSDIEIPLNHPHAIVQCYAVDPNTGVPPWNLASDLAGAVAAGCSSPLAVEQLLTLPNCDQNARLLTAYTTTMPRRSYADQGDYACMELGLVLNWTTR